MSQKPDISTFDIRKFSLFKVEKEKENNGTNRRANEWFHFPQRSDITINFFKYLTEENSFHISIIWKGNVLDQTYWHQGTNNFISSIGKFPSLGFKIVTPKGELVKRFQVSFNTKDLYDKCCKCVQEKLKVILNQIDATEVNGNSQIVDYPSQKMASILQVPQAASGPWGIAPTNQDFYSSSQTLRRPQYIPPPKHNVSYSQLDRSASLSNITLEQRKCTQLNPSQQIREVSQLSKNHYSGNYYLPEVRYIEYQHPGTYLQASTQQDMYNRDEISQNMGIPLQLANIDYNHDKVSHSNTEPTRPIGWNNHIPTSKNRGLIRNEPFDNNVQPKNKEIEKNHVIICDGPVEKNKSIKEEEVLPTKIANKFVLLNVSAGGVQKSSRKQKPKKQYDLLKMKDAELKLLITQKLKDEEFVKFVERLDKIVSQP